MVENAGPIRIAMWSGPRNISTALMRSWGNRPDTAVSDEPFYAHYLKATGLDHPGADEIIATGETHWRKVVVYLNGPAPGDKQIWYQKQMAHHLTFEMGRGWLAGLTNCFLIRDPREVITSYIRKNRDPAVADLGFIQQWEIFQWVREHTSSIPPILDARDVLENPERILRLLCRAVGVEFTEAMLSWPPGARATDGIWAKHWYSEVEASTSFRRYQAKSEDVPDRLRGVYERCREIYDRLHQHRLR